MTQESGEAFGTAIAGLAAHTVRARLREQFTDAAGLLRQVIGDDGELHAAFQRKAASFVTLQRDGQLRGCIGSLSARRPLYMDVIHNARQSLIDPRLRPVDASEWPRLTVSVSVLTAPEPLAVSDRRQLHQRLRPGIDGLTLRLDGKRATFLPAVWRSLQTPERFVSALLAKGGWVDTEWPSGILVERYSAHSFVNSPPRPELEQE